MQARRKTRLYIVLAVLAGLGLTVSLTLYALSSNIDLFYTPGEIIYGKTETRALPHTGQRLRVGGPDETRAGQVGLDRVHDDLLVAERGGLQEHPQRVDERGIGAVVAGQGGADVGAPRGVEIGDDVTAAEGVDRLFRVPDEHERAGVPRERAL